MARDNRDRYGYRHRTDDDYNMGESKPGDVGDSKGTFHDRAGQDKNVIVDGSAKSYESHKRTKQEVTTSSSKSSKDPSNESQPSATESVSQSEVVGKVVELTADTSGGVHDAFGSYKNHQVHMKDVVPGETVRVRLEKGNGYLVDQPVTVRE